MVSRIYFDMDGVLADFDRGVLELCGMETLPQSTRSPEQTMKELRDLGIL